MQTVFYRMLKYRYTFTGDGEFRAWMYHLARNVLADFAKKNRHAAHHTDVAEHLVGGLSADAGLEQAQDVVQLHQALERLRPEDCEILVLSRFQELKYAEIARVLGTIEGTVKVRVHRAMNELKTTYLRIEN